MNMVTLYAIATLANGTPRAVQHTVPAERCEGYARHFRHEHPTAIIWCRSELAPGGFVSDLRPPGPNAADILGMPHGRDAKP